MQYEFYSFSLLNVDILLLKKFHILFSAGTQFFGCLDKEKTSGERPSIFCLDADLTLIWAVWFWFRYLPSAG